MGEIAEHQHQEREAATKEVSSDRSAEARERAPTTVREYEYRDSEGNFLGKAIVELDKEEIFGFEHKTLSGEVGKGHTVRSVMIQNEQGVEIDIFAMANNHNVQVVMASERLENYYYDFKGRNKVVVPPLETPFDVGVFLHELGHANQDRESDFDGIVQMADKQKRGKMGVYRFLEKMTDEFPQIRDIIDISKLDKEKMLQLDAKIDEEEKIWSGALDEIKNCEAGIMAALKITTAPFYEGMYESDEYKSSIKKIDELRLRTNILKKLSEEKIGVLSQLGAEMRALVSLPDEIIEDLREAPNRILEIDATRRAVEVLRKMKDMGVDLLRKHHVKRSAAHSSKFDAAGDCISSTSAGLDEGVNSGDDIETTVFEELRSGLRSYRTGRLDIKTPEGKRVKLKK